MNTSRKLEDIASNLDDISVTLEEIKDTVENGDSGDDDPRDAKLDKIQHGVDRAADTIEELIDPDVPGKE